MRTAILLILDWRDGPIEGVIRNTTDDDDTCWYFKLFAERSEQESPDNRLFGVWPLPSADASVLIQEFGDASSGTHVWPTIGGIGSQEARQVVEGLLSRVLVLPSVLMRTEDFVSVAEVWTVVSTS